MEQRKLAACAIHFYMAQIRLFRKQLIYSAGGLPEAKKRIERAGAH
jgi:hypothetical protein